MYKYLWSISFVILSAQGIAESATIIKAAEVTSPVYVGVFRGFCDTLNLKKLQKQNDFTATGNKTCQYVTDQILDPKKPNANLKVWHQGAGSLNLIAFQDGVTPIKCVIDDEYKTMFVLGGPDGLKCTSPEVAGTDQQNDIPSNMAAPLENAIAEDGTWGE